MHDAEPVLKDHEIVHQTSLIRVLSGREKAYYGWVALNYQMGRLLDLGSSSLQVAVEENYDDNSQRYLIRSIKRTQSVGLNALVCSSATFERSIAMLI